MCAGSADAATIDDFSTNSLSSYDVFNLYGDPLTYGIAGGRFVPTKEPGAFNAGYSVFYRNTGEILGSAGGDAVSIDIISIDDRNGAAGLGLGATTSSDNNIFQPFIRNAGGTYKFQLFTNGQGENVDNDLSALGFNLASPATLSLVRDITNPASFEVSISGGGLQIPFTTTITPSSGAFTQDLFFGMVQYTGDNSPIAAVQDNLSFTAVPEPSTGLAVLGGTASLLGMRRRRA
jgi:hypothetical protein